MLNAGLADLDASSVEHTPRLFDRCRPQSARLEVLYEAELISVERSLVSFEWVDRVKMETNR